LRQEENQYINKTCTKCHETKKVRGLLYDRCNTIAFYEKLNSEPELVETICKYLHARS